MFVDPITIQKLTMREAVNNLCKLVETTMVSLGSTKYIKTIKEILNQGLEPKNRENYITVRIILNICCNL